MKLINPINYHENDELYPSAVQRFDTIHLFYLILNKSIKYCPNKCLFDKNAENLPKLKNDA